MDQYWEESGYLASMSAKHQLSKNLTDEEMLAGTLLSSLETDSELERDNAVSFISGHLGSFLQSIKILHRDNQDFMLAYYLLRVNQTRIASIFESVTQTVVSSTLRASVRAMSFHLVHGPNPDTEWMASVLDSAKLLHSDVLHVEQCHRMEADWALIIHDYAAVRDYPKVAKIHHIHRPEIRRGMNRIAKTLSEGNHDQKALGAYIIGLTDHTSPRVLSREGAPKKTVRRKDPPECGAFRINVESKGFRSLFIAKSNI